MGVRVFNMYEAKANLSKLVDAAIAGEEIIVARNGRRLVKMIPYDDPTEAWTGHGFGSDPTLVVPDDFDEPLPDDILKSFYS